MEPTVGAAGIITWTIVNSIAGRVARKNARYLRVINAVVARLAVGLCRNELNRLHHPAAVATGRNNAGNGGGIPPIPYSLGNIASACKSL